MALPQFFFIKGYEIGGRQKGFLQYLDGQTWTNLGAWVANNTSIIINSEVNPIPVDYDIFSVGETYCFRLVDDIYHPVSNVVCFTFPIDEKTLLNLDGTPLLNLDGTPLLNL